MIERSSTPFPHRNLLRGLSFTEENEELGRIFASSLKSFSYVICHLPLLLPLFLNDK